MRIPRAYLAPSSFIDHGVRHAEETVHYLTRVLRLRTGDHWAALDGAQRSWLCEIIDKDHSRKIDDWPAVPPLPIAIELGLALCKGSRFEDAIEKMAELGVVRLIPLETERTERGRPSQAKRHRWDQIAKSGSALANRLVPLEISATRQLTDLLPDLRPSTAIYCHDNGSSPWETFHPPRNTFTILIGPEGGFSPAELEGLQDRARRVSLGPLTLRVETAAVAAVSLALALAGRPI